LAFVTEDRRHDGLLLDPPIVDDVALAALPQFGTWVRDRMLRTQIAAQADRVRLGFAKVQHLTARKLSGGNQQKVVLAKWLLTNPRVLILDEPTRGVDVGARAEIYKAVNDAVARGMGVLMISSEIEELIGTCDRILVLASGRIQSEYRRDQFDREAILRSALTGRAA
jgi:ribose transport system ATP-binding protein